jgi:NADPH-dependent F420 reductase
LQRRQTDAIAGQPGIEPAHGLRRRRAATGPPLGSRAMTDLPPFPTDRIVAVLGGTGPQGRGLARRFSQAGIPVVLGSRSAERAAETATELGEATGGTVSGTDNATAAGQGVVVVVAVPWDGHAELLRDLAGQLAGKVVVDCVNPLGFDKQGAYPLPVEEGSAAQQAAALLPDSTVVGAFHNVSAVLLDDPEVSSVDTDVLVLGDDRDATELVQALASVVPGVRGVYGGRLRNCHQVEALTANLISINRRYKAHSGIRVTDL